MMKLAKRAAALVLAAVLALSLTACSPKEVASNLILKTADMLGLREEGSDDDEADEIVAQPGGEVNFPDGLRIPRSTGTNRCRMGRCMLRLTASRTATPSILWRVPIPCR